jgi:hypothetical protein
VASKAGHRYARSEHESRHGAGAVRRPRERFRRLGASRSLRSEHVNGGRVPRLTCAEALVGRGFFASVGPEGSTAPIRHPAAGGGVRIQGMQRTGTCPELTASRSFPNVARLGARRGVHRDRDRAAGVLRPVRLSGQARRRLPVGFVGRDNVGYCGQAYGGDTTGPRRSRAVRASARFCCRTLRSCMPRRDTDSKQWPPLGRVSPGHQRSGGTKSFFAAAGMTGRHGQDDGVPVPLRIPSVRTVPMVSIKPATFHDRPARVGPGPDDGSGRQRRAPRVAQLGVARSSRGRS